MYYGDRHATDVVFDILQVMLDFSPLDSLKTGHYQRAWYYIFGAMGSAWCGLIALALSGYATLALFALAIVLVFMAINQFVYAKTVDDTNRGAYLEFAHRNAFTYEPTTDSVLNGTGTLFNHGSDKVTRNVLSGKTASGLPMQTFHYEYVTGSGKSRQVHLASVMRITLPRTLPHMVIDSLTEGTMASVLPIQFDQSQQVKVEGDFNRYFSLYAPDTYAVSLLTVIGPDVMWTLMQHAAACDIEIIDNYIYFYWPFLPQRRSEYESMFATTDAVLKEVGKKLTQGNIYTSDSQAQLHSQVQAGGGGVGVRLTKRKISVWTVLFIGVAVLMYAQPFLGEFGISASIVGPIVTVFILGSLIATAVKGNQAQKRRQELLQRFGPSEPKQQ